MRQFGVVLVLVNSGLVLSLPGDLSVFVICYGESLCFFLVYLPPAFIFFFRIVLFVIFVVVASLVIDFCHLDLIFVAFCF